jgi:nitrite reductase/ring-hydroxylating ferredoxin subunit
MQNIIESTEIELVWHDVGDPADFPDGDVAAVVADGIDIAVFRCGDELFALKDKCTHGRAKLSEGFIEDDCVECPLHQGKFAIRTGEPMSEPVVKAVKSFPVRVVAGRVLIQTAA